MTSQLMNELVCLKHCCVYEWTLDLAIIASSAFFSAHNNDIRSLHIIGYIL